MKYSRQDIEDAATICAIKSASKFAGRYAFLDDIADSVQASAGGSNVARDLACGAFLFVFYHPNTTRMSFAEGWAEAEALLRTGWLPPGATRARREP